MQALQPNETYKLVVGCGGVLGTQLETHTSTPACSMSPPTQQLLAVQAIPPSPRKAAIKACSLTLQTQPRTFETHIYLRPP
jgi:hypothetical protein